MVYIYVSDNGVRQIGASAKEVGGLIEMSAGHILRVLSRGKGYYRGRGYVLVRFNKAPKQKARNVNGNLDFIKK